MAISSRESSKEGAEARAEVSGPSATSAPPSGPELFWNLPNSVTMLRVAVVPVLHIRSQSVGRVL